MLEEATRNAIAEKRHLRDVLAADQWVTAHLPAGEIERPFDPLSYQEGSQTLIDRVLAQAKIR